MQPPSRCRIPKNGPRAAFASNARLLLGKLSVIAPPFEAVSVVRSRNQGRQAPRALSLSAQPRQIFAACQSSGCHSEADGRGQGQAEQAVLTSRSSRLQAGARPVSLPPAPVLLRFIVGDGRGCALIVALSRGVRPLSAITSGG